MGVECAEGGDYGFGAERNSQMSACHAERYAAKGLALEFRPDSSRSTAQNDTYIEGIGVFCCWGFFVRRLRAVGKDDHRRSGWSRRFHDCGGGGSVDCEGQRGT